MIDRRTFVRISSIMAGSLWANSAFPAREDSLIMTVKGPIASNGMGTTLIHEHILVDFIGADLYDPSRWEHDAVIKKVFPYLSDLRRAGCETLIDCTPNYLGRDVILLQKLSELSGLKIITNTGYYGGSDVRFLPEHAKTETEQQLSSRWINEWKEGIDGTSVKPGFIKTSVNADHLTPISQKLIHAAAITHLATGLTIASHTGPAVAAFEQIEILKSHGVSPNAFIWVHAQTETDKSNYVKAARMGAWISLDGLNEANIIEYVTMLSALKKASCLHRTLISHDAGWYEPGKGLGGNFRPYTTLFEKLLPALDVNGFTEDEIFQLVRDNPREAFVIKVRQ